MCVLSSSQCKKQVENQTGLLVGRIQNIFRAILTKLCLKDRNNRQTLLFNIYLSKANRMCLKTYYCLKLIH